jgi:hypothetical protein
LYSTIINCKDHFAPVTKLVIFSPESQSIETDLAYLKLLPNQERLAESQLPMPQAIGVIIEIL